MEMPKKKKKRRKKTSLLKSSQTLMEDLWCVRPVRPNPREKTYMLRKVKAAVSWPKSAPKHNKNYNEFSARVHYNGEPGDADLDEDEAGPTEAYEHGEERVFDDEADEGGCP